MLRAVQQRRCRPQSCRKKTPEVIAAIEELMKYEVAGDPRKVKILMRLPYGRNVATRQAVHGSAP